MNPAAFGQGINHFLAGFALVRQPGLRRYVLIPLLVNLVIFVLAVWLAADHFAGLMEALTARLPDWLDWVAWLLWVLLAMLLLIVIFYGFTLVANIIGAPFNSLLAARVEERLTGQKPGGTTSLGFLADAWQDLISEALKLRYFLGLVAVGAVVSLAMLPFGITAPLLPILWFLISAWSLALEYSDYPLSNRGIRFSEQRLQARTRRSLMLGFGTAATIATMIPLVNFTVMPVAVAGATRMWVMNRESNIVDSGPAA
ncbi:MAG: sulfate transporter CysZ [Gammaproteobacteria bacterium]